MTILHNSDRSGYNFLKKMVPRVGVEPTWALSPLDFESSAYTNFATPAGELKIILFFDS